MPETSVHPSPGKLARILLEQLPDSEIIPIARRHFNDAQGLNCVKNFGLSHDENGMEVTIVVGLSTKYYALAAVQALLNYVESVHSLTFTPKSIKFHWKTLEGTMLIGKLLT